MPLTLAHPVAVLPLKRCGLPLSALVVGSISPDLEYLLHLAPVGGIGHTPAGLLVFCLPAGLSALWIVHRIWERPMRSMFSPAAQDSAGPRYKLFAFWPISRLGLVCLAILIGAITHLLWDSFTHKHGWMVQQFPLLSRPILRTHWGDAPVYKILQHGSTLLGAFDFGDDGRAALHGRPAHSACGVGDDHVCLLRESGRGDCNWVSENGRRDGIWLHAWNSWHWHCIIFCIGLRANYTA